MLHRLSLVLAFLTLSTSVISASIPHDHDHEPVRRSLPGTWYQPEDHPAHALFRRDASDDGVTYAEVGSDAWRAGFPRGKPNPAQLPQAWVDALNAAIAAGLVPTNVPVSNPNNGMPTYGGLDPTGAQVCSTTYKCMGNADVWNAPDGVFGISFDDGPLPGTSDTLYGFLKENNVKATHFFIGVNIFNNPQQFLRAFQDNEDDIAVHTYTHPYMTTLSNEDVLGELGWTTYIIYNSTGGRLPKYWRPPYGDSDNRVSAIAQHVFGLKTVIWNHDTEDWSIGEPNGATSASVQANLKKWLTGPKSPGIITLEHELTDATVGAFITAFPMIKENGWNMVSVAQLDGGSAYQNADDDAGAITSSTSIFSNGASPNGTSSNTTVSSSTGSSSSSTGSTSSMQSTHSPTTSTTATDPTGTLAGTGAPGAGVPGGQGSKQANITNSAPSPSGSAGATKQQQQSGASSFVQAAVLDARGMLAAFLTVFFSAVALA